MFLWVGHVFKQLYTLHLDWTHSVESDTGKADRFVKKMIY